MTLCVVDDVVAQVTSRTLVDKMMAHLGTHQGLMLRVDRPYIKNTEC